MVTKTTEFVVSDRSGKVVEPQNVAQLVVRKHPRIPTGSGRIVDLDVQELKELSVVTEGVHAQLRLPDGGVLDIMMSVEALSTFIDDSALLGAASIKGRKRLPRPLKAH